jgi:drug/metabolite transporter (DMT)-like permease
MYEHKSRVNFSGVTRPKTYLADFLLLTAVIVWGVNFALMKRMYIYFHPIAFNAVRFVISSITMLATLKLRGETQHIDRKDWPGILWLAFLGNVLYPFIFVLGLARTRAGTAALLMALTPVFAFLIGVAMKKERFSTGVLTGIVLSIAGAAAIVLLGASEVSFTGSWTGDLLMIAAAICWAWQSAESTRLLPKYGPIRLTVYSMVAGTLVMVPLSIPWLVSQNWTAIPLFGWLGLGYSALLSITYAYFIWAYAISTIGVAHTSVFNNVTPIVALFAGWLLLDEIPSSVQFSGVVLIIVGVFIVRSRKPIALPDE